MNENENSLSERFVEHAAAAYKRMGLSDEDYWLQQLGRWMFLDRDAILVALRTAESPTASPDATEAARAMREVEEAVQAKITEAEIQCAKHAPMGGINYLSWFGRLAGLNYALASIAAAKSKGGEG